MMTSTYSGPYLLAIIMQVHGIYMSKHETGQRALYLKTEYHDLPSIMSDSLQVHAPFG